MWCCSFIWSTSYLFFVHVSGHLPAFAVHQQSVSVKEGASIGTLLTNASSMSLLEAPDKNLYVEYSMMANKYGSIFTLNTNNGDLKLGRILDYEQGIKDFQVTVCKTITYLSKFTSFIVLQYVCC